MRLSDNQHLSVHSGRCCHSVVLPDDCRADSKNQYSYVCDLLSATQDGILIELEKELKGEDCMPRKIAGLLFFIYRSLSADAEHCSYNDELFLAVAKLEDMLDRILWDSPFKN